jgi:hypothetical protein
MGFGFSVPATGVNQTEIPRVPKVRRNLAVDGGARTAEVGETLGHCEKIITDSSATPGVYRHDTSAIWNHY